VVTPEVGIGIVCMGFSTFFVLLFGTLALMRWFRHKERMAMIEQGMMLDETVKTRNGKSTLAWGIGITAFGLALLCGLLSLSLSRDGSTRSMASVGPILLPGLIILFMGMALIIIYFVTRPAPAETSLETPPLLVESEEMPDLLALEPQEDEKAPEEGENGS
jgi:hypothetical protein